MTDRLPPPATDDWIKKVQPGLYTLEDAVRDIALILVLENNGWAGEGDTERVEAAVARLKRIVP